MSHQFLIGAKMLSGKKLIWLVVGLALVAAIMFAILRHRKPGGKAFMGAGVKDTPIVMEGGSIHGSAFYNWTPDPKNYQHFTTTLKNPIQRIVVRDPADPIDLLNVPLNGTNVWEVSLVRKDPEGQETDEAVSISPNLLSELGGDPSGIAIDIKTKLVAMPNGTSDIQFEADPHCKDGVTRCDVLSKVKVKLGNQDPQVIVCESKRGSADGKCIVKFNMAP